MTFTASCVIIDSMKANEVLKTLRITRPTLSRYVKEGFIKVCVLGSGRYDYDKESVFAFLNKELKRKHVIYGRVSTKKQAKDLDNQIESIKTFCLAKGISIGGVYRDIGSGITFERKEFERLLEDVVNFDIDTVYITYRDRLSKISFNMFKNLFAKFGTNIVVLNDTDNTQPLENEVIKEIIDLIHCFSMKVYSKKGRKNLKKIEKIVKDNKVSE